MTTKDNAHSISDADLDAHRQDAEFRMQNVPMRGISHDLVAELRKLPGAGGYLLSEPVGEMLLGLRRGICLFFELYQELTNKVDPKQVAFIDAFALYGMAALIAHELPEQEGENLATFPKPGAGFFKVGLGPDDDLKAILSFYLKAVTQKSPDNTYVVETPADIVNLTRDYFSALRDQLAADAEGHPADLTAQVEGSTIKVGEIELRGFSTAAQGKIEKVEFTPVLPEQIVGNSGAKRALIRYVDRLALYDAQQGFNPILELGGLPSTVLFDGFPGTGKTSLFRMAMTRMNQRAEQVGLPARYIMIDPGIKDEYYGRTAKLLNEKLGTVRDRGALVLVFFDDVDLLLLSRGDPGMGGADKDVLNITMQFLDGAFTTHVGNAQTYAATNEPTSTDSALRQRFHHREAIDGPETWEDYARLTQIKLARQIKRGLIQVGGEIPAPAVATAQPARGGLKLPNPFAGKKQMSWRELGELCLEFKKRDPRFTGRPIESVTQKLLAESADFEIPEEWFGDPTIYLQKSYEEKVTLLQSLYRPITGEMIAAELEQYFNSEQRYADDALVQRAERVAKDLEAQLLARNLLAQRAANTEE
jgi:hypothetical protein